MQLPLSGLAAAFGFKAHIFTVRLALNRRKFKKKKKVGNALGNKAKKEREGLFSGARAGSKGDSDSCCGLENMTCEVLKWWCASFLPLGGETASSVDERCGLHPKKDMPSVVSSNDSQHLPSLYGGAVTRNPCKTLGKVMVWVTGSITRPDKGLSAGKISNQKQSQV